MTSEHIALRNRANAQHSSGPQTQAGKAKVAQNARRHGLTSQPDPGSVTLWLRVILCQPDLSPDDYLKDDPRIFAALKLAEAEVRLRLACAELDRFERGTAPLSETAKALQSRAADITDALLADGLPPKQHLAGLSLLRQIGRKITDDTSLGGKRHTLMQRYVREATAARRRAFQSWVDLLGEGHKAA